MEMKIFIFVYLILSFLQDWVSLSRHPMWIIQQYREQDFLRFLIDANKEVNLIFAGLCLKASHFGPLTSGQHSDLPS